MVIPGERIAGGESEDTDDTDSVHGTASIGDVDRTAPGILTVYLSGDINGLAKKLHLLAAEFFVGNTTVRHELVNALDSLLETIDT